MKVLWEWKLFYLIALMPLYELASCTDKKENKIFLTYKEIQKGAVAKSYMTNGRPPHI